MGVRGPRRSGGCRVPVRNQGGLHRRARGRDRAVRPVRDGGQVDAQARSVTRGVEGGHRRGEASKGRRGSRRRGPKSRHSIGPAGVTS